MPSQAEFSPKIKIPEAELSAKKESDKENLVAEFLPEINKTKKEMEAILQENVQKVAEVLFVLDNNEVFVESSDEEPKLWLLLIQEINRDLANLRDLKIDELKPAIRTIQNKLAVAKNVLAEDKRKRLPERKKISDMEEERKRLALEFSQVGKRGFLRSLFAPNARSKIWAEMKQVNEQMEELSPREENFRAIELKQQNDLDTIFTELQKVGEVAIRKLFYLAKNEQHKISLLLSSPQVKGQMNEFLIREKLMPEFKKAKELGRTPIEESEAQEFFELLKIKLAEGSQEAWNYPRGKKAEVEDRKRAMEYLNEKSKYYLTDLVRPLDNAGQDIPDNNYDQIFDLLLAGDTTEKAVGLSQQLISSTHPKWQEVIRKSLADNLQNSKKDLPFNINDIPVDHFIKLNGFARWPAIKEFCLQLGIKNAHEFQEIEMTMIKKLYDEKLANETSDDFEASLAINIICQMNNPEALPLLTNFLLEKNRANTTSTVILAISRMLKDNSSPELAGVLARMEPTIGTYFGLLSDQGSYLNLFKSTNDPHTLLYYFREREILVSQEEFTKVFEKAGMDKASLKEFYLLNGDREQLFAQLKEAINLSGFNESEIIKKYFTTLTSHVSPDSPEQLKIIEPIAKSLGISREDVLIKCFDKFNNPPRNNTLRKVASPEDKNYHAFPLALAEQAFALSPEMLAVMEKIYGTKTLQTSGFEREAYLDGLAFLQKKENGSKVLKELLGAYRGTKDDPKRIRRILQLLSTLDSYGVYEYVGKPTEEIEKQKKAIEELQESLKKTEEQLKETADEKKKTECKVKKKEIKNRIEGFEVELNNLTGLKGIENRLIEKVVEAFGKLLNLPTEYLEKLKNQLEELTVKGIIEILSSLAGNYEKINEPDVKKLLTEITIKLLDDNFLTWKYNHEKSVEQLAVIAEDKKIFWRTNLPEVSVRIEKDSDQHQAEFLSVREIVKTIKAHARQSQFIMDFDPQTLAFFSSELNDLKQIDLANLDKDSRENLQKKIIAMQSRMLLLQGILEIEGVPQKIFSNELIKPIAEKMKNAVNKTSENEIAMDIMQIEKVFSVGKIKEVVATESDDILTLLRVGVEPQETCQSWRSGGFNQCLLAYVADSNKKMVNVADENGRTIARSMVKLTKRKEPTAIDGEAEQPTLLVEQPYSLIANKEIYVALFRVLFAKADGLNSSITMDEEFQEEIMEELIKEADKFGYILRRSNFEVFIPASKNVYEYSDALGGKISKFNQYKPALNFVSFEKKK
ncbi:MAG: hypothetical protein WCT18_03455 [Patescibacteria group bacterium]